jgi:AbiV family abortive infection protein
MIRYKGPLNIEQFIVARHKILINSRNLIEEATILYNNGKLSRSYFLLTIANEEFGKYILLTGAIVEYLKGTINWSKFWKKMRDHKVKLGTFEHAKNVLLADDDHFRNPNEINSIIPELDDYKMAALYSDFCENDFYEPNEIISEFCVQQLLKQSKYLITYFETNAPPDDSIRNKRKEDLWFSEKIFQQKSK